MDDSDSFMLSEVVESPVSSKRKAASSGKRGLPLPGADEEDAEDAEEAIAVDVRKPSQSKQWLAVMSKGGRPKGKRQARTAAEAVVAAVAAPDDPQHQAYVPPAVRGSGLDVVVRAAKRADDVAAALKKRSGGRKARKRELDPAAKAASGGAASACWVFFRAARKGESPGYVYCMACECIGQTPQGAALGAVAISSYGTDMPFLKSSNAVSHISKQHGKWWKAVESAANDGHDAKATFQTLFDASAPVSVQTQSTLDGTVTRAARQPGKLEKELRLVLWMVRNCIPFASLDDPFFADTMRSFGVSLSKPKSLKRLLFPLFLIAVQHGEARIKAAQSYSIAFDYWTSVANDKYLAITYHYADENMRVFSRLLDLVSVDSSATALVTKEVIDSRLVKHFESSRRLFK
jgi:hypothetical protein